MCRIPLSRLFLFELDVPPLSDTVRARIHQVSISFSLVILPLSAKLNMDGSGNDGERPRCASIIDRTDPRLGRNHPGNQLRQIFTVIVAENTGGVQNIKEWSLGYCGLVKEFSLVFTRHPSEIFYVDKSGLHGNGRLKWSQTFVQSLYSIPVLQNNTLQSSIQKRIRRILPVDEPEGLYMLFHRDDLRDIYIMVPEPHGVGRSLPSIVGQRISTGSRIPAVFDTEILWDNMPQGKSLSPVGAEVSPDGKHIAALYVMVSESENSDDVEYSYYLVVWEISKAPFDDTTPWARKHFSDSIAYDYSYEWSSRCPWEFNFCLSFGRNGTLLSPCGVHDVVDGERCIEWDSKLFDFETQSMYIASNGELLLRHTHYDEQELEIIDLDSHVLWTNLDFEQEVGKIMSMRVNEISFIHTGDDGACELRAIPWEAFRTCEGGGIPSLCVRAKLNADVTVLGYRYLQGILFLISQCTIDGMSLNGDIYCFGKDFPMPGNVQIIYCWQIAKDIPPIQVYALNREFSITGVAITQDMKICTLTSSECQLVEMDIPEGTFGESVGLGPSKSGQQKDANSGLGFSRFEHGISDCGTRLCFLRLQIPK